MGRKKRNRFHLRQTDSRQLVIIHTRRTDHPLSISIGVSKMASVGQARATLDDLYRAPFKAELVDGRIVPLMASGHKPNRVAGRIYRSLDEHTDKIGKGYAYTDNMGFAVKELLPDRESF